MQTMTSVWEQMALNSRSLQQLGMAKNNDSRGLWVMLSVLIKTVLLVKAGQVILLIYNTETTQQQRTND